MFGTNLKAAALAAATMFMGGSQAALVARAGGMVYDTTRNITWLADMNYAKTQWDTSGGTQGDSDGRMTWAAATAWADNLVYGGFSDWRLPTVNPADASCTGGFGVGYGYSCTGGELSGLFVTDLGNKANESVLNQVGDTPDQIANLALFSNVQSYFYWSGTEYAPSPDLAWTFRTLVGFQTTDFKYDALYAVAVRPGDVAASGPGPGTVPEPATLALMGIALAGLAATRPRKR